MPRRHRQRRVAKAISAKSKPYACGFDSYKAPIALFAGPRRRGSLQSNRRAFVLGNGTSFCERAQFAASARSQQESITFATIVKLRRVMLLALLVLARSTAFAQRWVPRRLASMRRSCFSRKPAARNRQPALPGLLASFPIAGFGLADQADRIAQ
jgi:hypothetical protein